MLWRSPFPLVIFPRMTQHARSLTQASAKGRAAPSHRRISAPIREAIDLYVKQGKTWKQAADLAGLSEAGIHKARTKPHVQALIEQVKAQYVQEVEAMRAPYRAEAMEHARYLMRNAASEAVQARMVEFLGREPDKPAQIVVQNNVYAGQYAYPSLARDVTPHDAASSDVVDAEPSQQWSSGKR